MLKNPSPDVIKKILCDALTVACAEETSVLAKKGIFKPWQLKALAKHDIEYQRVHIAIATGNFDEALKLLPELSRDEP